LEILKPHIVICLGTIDYFDIIYNYSDEEKKLYEKKIYSNNNRNCWISNNVIVLDFYHPSYWKMNDERKLYLMKQFVADKLVKSEYLQIIKN